MKNTNQAIGAVLLSALILFMFAAGCTSKKHDKIPLTTSSKEALRLFMQGRDLQERLQFQESLQHFEQAVEKDPDFAMAWLYLAQAQPTNKGFFENLDKAVALIDKVSEGEKLWISGVQAGVNGFPMQQRENYQKLTELYPNDERAHNLLGIHYFGVQQWALAIPECRKVTEINPKFSQAYNQLGYAHRFLKNYNEAEIAFRKYIELIPDDPNPYDSFAELQMKIGNFDASIESYNQALEQNPNFVASFLGIALNLNLKGDYEGAREQLQKLYDIARNDGERRAALFSKAVSYAFEGNMEEALRVEEERYALAAKINDTQAMAGDLFLIGNIYLEIDKADEAMAKYIEAVRIVEASDLAQEVKDNAKRQYLFNSGRAALKKGNIESAQAKSSEYRNAVEAVNSPVQIRLAHQLAGMIALEQGDFEGAVTELQQAPTDFNPQNFYRIALAYEGLGDMEKANHYFEEAAHFNGLGGFTYAFCRAKATQKLE